MRASSHPISVMAPPVKTSLPSSISYRPPMVLQPAFAVSEPSWKASRILVPATSGRGCPPWVTSTDRKSRPLIEPRPLLAGGVDGEAGAGVVGVAVGGLVGEVVGG